MIYSQPKSSRLPPRLSMDEYADFVEASLRQCDRARATLQKEIEERIRMPFRMEEDQPSTHAPPRSHTPKLCSPPLSP